MKPLVPYWKHNLKCFLDAVIWANVIFIPSVLILSYVIWGWWGVFNAIWIGLLILQLSQGAIIYHISFPEEEVKTKRKDFYCSICEKWHTVYLRDEK